VAKKTTKVKEKTKEQKPKGGTLDGLRRANAVRKQIGRWMERKWPMPSNAEEWLRFAGALRAEAAIIEADALSHVNPSMLVKSKKELLQQRVVAANVKPEAEDEEGEEEEGK
jgi:HD-like signal output (HDOD) protein